MIKEYSITKKNIYNLKKEWFITMKDLSDLSGLLRKF